MARGFVSARTLSAGFHDDVVRRVLGGIPYAAGLLGWGSDVLGYDTERSTDHGWGPRLHVLVDEDQVSDVTKLIEAHLPTQYEGYDVRFGWDTQEPVHHITVKTVGGWLEDQVGRDVSDGMSTEDWLITPQQQLLGVVAGPVYADDGRLAKIRDALAWYPDDVWHWLLACQWKRIAEEESFVQRTSEVGDELGSRIVAARLARDLIRLALLMARTYAPYTKWLGTAFARLPHHDGLHNDLSDATSAQTHEQREKALTAAYEKVARRHNELGITEYVDPAPRQYHDRPAMVLQAGRFAEACLTKVGDPWLRGLELVGSIDQFADNTDLLGDGTVYRRLTAIYEK
ncbi:DUF4037 domain-containing protein [Kribbella sp. NPDC006257]|uniref:DUF4037 domain-containing protein n=1 Tax=Kribbella sp. NPDC006257 TaxID=3156738 RepID=UPI00339E65FF